MIIKLPKEFQMESISCKKGVYIEDGILKIKRDMSFRKVMTEITYKNKGKKRCCYCKKIVPEGEMTMDHMYPQEFGGPTIPENMLPCCQKCNGEKANKNTKQYKAFLKAQKEHKIETIKKQIEIEQQYIRKSGEFGIPKEWITEKEVSNIIVIVNLEEDYRKNSYHKIAKYYQIYNHFQKPIIIDRNGFLLDGFLILMYAKNNGLKSIPVIQLDNVEVFL